MGIQHQIGLTPGSRKKVWWRCSRGHEWEATPNNRTCGTGCPYCFNEKRGGLIRKAALKRSGSLVTRNHELVKEWHPSMNGTLKPSDVTPGRGVWFNGGEGVA